MATLVASVQSHDDTFKRQVARLLRDGRPAIGVIDERSKTDAVPDLVIVDGRNSLSTAMAAVERMRVAAPAVSIFLVAPVVNSALILQAMHAGANEVIAWPPSDGAFEEGIRRLSERRRASGGTTRESSVITFIGAKGGVGTTTLAVNCGVELAGKKRRTSVLDLKPGLGDAALFLGVHSRHTLLDAIENAHRLDASLLDGLLAKHLSGLELLPGSDQFHRPTGNDGEAVETILRLLADRCEYTVVDAGCQVNASSRAALAVSDMVGVVMNPDVPSIRNARRLIECIAEMGFAGDRVRVLLNRAGEPYPIPFNEIEDALGTRVYLTIPSDYKSVATALNAGVPLTFGNNAEIATQFGRLVGSILNPSTSVQQADPPRKAGFRFPRFASAR
jgi:pilus assembly protein CpaE